MAEPTPMEFVIDKSDLLKELAVTQGVVGHKSTIPIISSFLFEAVGSTLLITGTDLDVSLRTFCSARVIQEGSCTVPARKLYDYVRLLRDGEITVKLLANHWVQIRSGRSNTKMVGMPRDNFPALPLFPAQSAIQLPAVVLRTMIAKTIFAISQEESRYTLRGALLVIKPSLLTMVATDGHRLAHVEMLKSKVAVNGEIRVVVPAKAMGEIYSLLQSTDAESVGFAKDDSTLFFTIGTRLLTSRMLTGTFPNYEMVLPRDLSKSVEVPAAHLAQSVQRVAQFADERSGAVLFRMDKDSLRVSSSSPEAGESEDLLEATYSGDPSAIRFNSRYVRDFLKIAGGGKVKFFFKAPEAAGEFRTDPAADGLPDCNYRYIVMPMRS
jgi:DNA polymerase III subunit beta